MTAQASFNVARCCAQDCSLQQSFPVIPFCGGGFGKYGIEGLALVCAFGAGLRGGGSAGITEGHRSYFTLNWVMI